MEIVYRSGAVVANVTSDPVPHIPFLKALNQP